MFCFFANFRLFTAYSTIFTVACDCFVNSFNNNCLSTQWKKNSHCSLSEDTKSGVRPNLEPKLLSGSRSYIFPKFCNFYPVLDHTSCGRPKFLSGTGSEISRYFRGSCIRTLPFVGSVTQSHSPNMVEFEIPNGRLRPLLRPKKCQSV